MRDIPQNINTVLARAQILVARYLKSAVRENLKCSHQNKQTNKQKYNPKNLR